MWLLFDIPRSPFFRTNHTQLCAETGEQVSGGTRGTEHLKLLLAQLRRMQFGRKSEKLERQIEQLELRLQDRKTSPIPANGMQAALRPACAPITRHCLSGVSKLPGGEKSNRRPDSSNCTPKESATRCAPERKAIGEPSRLRVPYIRMRFAV